MLDAQIAQLNSADLDQLFDAAPEGTPNANMLETGKESKVVVAPQSEDIGDIPEDAFEDDIVTKEEKVEPEKVKATKKEEELDKKEEEPPKKEKEAKEVEEKEAPTGQINEVLKNTVEYLVNSGKWLDFEGREDLEMTQEVYADLTAKQDEYRLNQKFSELVDSTGDYGKAIINHIKNGGNPDVVIDIFKEQQQLQQIDTSTEAGKQQIIEKFYKEVVGFKPEKVEKDIKRFISEDRIEEEYNEVKDRYDKYYKDQLEKADMEVNEQKALEVKRKETFVTNIKTTLDSDKTLTTQDKKLIASSILDFKHDLGNGQKVNDFYVKFAEIQADPKEYIELVRFVMDRKNYEKAIESKKTTDVAKETFNFIKGNAAVSKTKTSPVEINERADRSTHKGTDFSFLVNR